ncbi:hypothetical protein BDR04DRAFT_1095537 [Suillus decipiens]|nr:hypothetical protein BDR04DRAFT_1095537 [Suillus decipiens]
MTIVSNDPSWWPMISRGIFFSYWTVSASVVVVYDCVLTLGQEIELIWRQRCSLMSVLYLMIRYIGIPYSVINVLSSVSFISLSDTGCKTMIYILNGTYVVIAPMLGVIMVVRLYVMYEKSRTMLIFLVIICLAVNIACGVIAAIGLKDTVLPEELILSGTYS